MSVNYAQLKALKGTLCKLRGQKKSAVGMLYGDMLSYNRANDNWEPGRCSFQQDHLGVVVLPTC